jgi:hypothetical protein
VVYWPAQVLYTGFVLTPVWIAGTVVVPAPPEARRFRPAGIAAVITLVLFFVAGGKPYYAGGIYTFLFAAGCGPHRALAGPEAGSARCWPPRHWALTHRRRGRDRGAAAAGRRAGHGPAAEDQL